MLPPARAQPEEIVEEILLRLPPDEPASIVRASLVSKLWLGLLSSPRFHGRYSEFHGAPPTLGVLISNPWDTPLPEEGYPIPPFVSTTKFRPRIPDDGSLHREYAVLDCRHGRVLLKKKNAAPTQLAVWDPMTSHLRKLQEHGCMGMVVGNEDGHLGAAVLCAVGGCDHHACHKGPSRVVFFSLHNNDRYSFVAQACVSLPETSDCSKPPRSDSHPGQWSQPCTALPIDPVGFIQPNPPILTQNAVHFLLGYEHESRHEVYKGTVWQHILKYDLSSNCLSLIDVPSVASRHFGDSMLMALEDGSLGFARWKRLTLHTWSRQMGSNGVAAWSRRKVISLKDVPPIKNSLDYWTVIGSVEGSDIIYLSTQVGIYEINLKTLGWKKIWKKANFNALIPYTCFYNPQEMVRAADVAR